LFPRWLQAASGGTDGQRRDRWFVGWPPSAWLLAAVPLFILGPDMSNFQNIATEMIQEKCALQISDKADLAKKLLFFLDKNNKKTSQELIDNARKFVDNRERTLDNYLKEIKKFL
jgi:3-deoxy-D-manno-octulosonic-acid transferase